jgi:hypothetical protein
MKKLCCREWQEVISKRIENIGGEQIKFAEKRKERW